jgi:hypothetical protein
VSAHDGLIVLVPMVERNGQIRLFGIVLDRIELLPNTVNKLPEIFSDGEIRVRDWSEQDNDSNYTATAGRPVGLNECPVQSALMPTLVAVANAPGILRQRFARNSGCLRFLACRGSRHLMARSATIGHDVVKRNRTSA